MKYRIQKVARSAVNGRFRDAARRALAPRYHRRRDLQDRAGDRRAATPDGDRRHARLSPPAAHTGLLRRQAAAQRRSRAAATVARCAHAVSRNARRRRHVVRAVHRDRGAIMNIVNYPLKRGQWYEEPTSKTYVVWHATEGRTRCTPASSRPDATARPLRSTRGTSTRPASARPTSSIATAPSTKPLPTPAGFSTSDCPARTAATTDRPWRSRAAKHHVGGPFRRRRTRPRSRTNKRIGYRSNEFYGTTIATILDAHFHAKFKTRCGYGSRPNRPAAMSRLGLRGHFIVSAASFATPVPSEVHPRDSVSSHFGTVLRRRNSCRHLLRKRHHARRGTAN